MAFEPKTNFGLYARDPHVQLALGSSCIIVGGMLMADPYKRPLRAGICFATSIVIGALSAPCFSSDSLVNFQAAKYLCFMHGISAENALVERRDSDGCIIGLRSVMAFGGVLGQSFIGSLMGAKMNLHSGERAMLFTALSLTAAIITRNIFSNFSQNSRETILRFLMISMAGVSLVDFDNLNTSVVLPMIVFGSIGYLLGFFISSFDQHPTRL